MFEKISTSKMFTVGDAIRRVKNILLQDKGYEMPEKQAFLLLSHVLGTSFQKIQNCLDMRLSAKQVNEVNNYLNYNCSLPVPLYIGYTEVLGTKIKVSRNVLLPGTETEKFILEIYNIGKNLKSPIIADMGTGSGVISIILSILLKQSKIIATDISKDSLVIAGENLRLHHLLSRVNLILCDWFKAIKQDSLRFDIIAANPPYLSDTDILNLPNVFSFFTPHKAIYGGKHGLDQFMKIVEVAHNYLKDSGSLILQINSGQSEKILNMIRKTTSYNEPKLILGSNNEVRIIIAKKKNH